MSCPETTCNCLCEQCIRARQTELINAAYTETERLNGTPTAIYAVKPLYATQPPPIPPHALHTRTRVKRRP